MDPTKERQESDSPEAALISKDPMDRFGATMNDIRFLDDEEENDTEDP